MEKRMRKATLISFVITALVLAGCIPELTSTPTLTPVTQATAMLTPVTQATATLTQTTQVNPAPTAALSLPAEVALAPSQGCTVITQKPTPGPTAESVFPPVSDTDWVKGPASAQVTILEYSDYQ
jgi:protein-disulfide isomerase